MIYNMSAEKIGNQVKPSPLISVVIPAYQAVNTIKRAVDSVLSIPLGSIEVIVVDDGSTDGTTGVLAEISASDTRLRVIRQDNSGRSVARNSGFGFSSGKWVMFLDADDYLLPGAFCSLIERAENSTADLVVFGMKKSDGMDQFGNSASWDSGGRDACNLEPVFVCAEDVAAAMIEDERYSFVMDRWKYESNSSWSSKKNSGSNHSLLGLSFPRTDSSISRCSRQWGINLSNSTPFRSISGISMSRAHVRR